MFFITFALYFLCDQLLSLNVIILFKNIFYYSKLYFVEQNIIVNQKIYYSINFLIEILGLIVFF